MNMLGTTTKLLTLATTSMSLQVRGALLFHLCPGTFLMMGGQVYGEDHKWFWILKIPQLDEGRHSLLLENHKSHGGGRGKAGPFPPELTSASLHGSLVQIRKTHSYRVPGDTWHT
jgi:hypothetical protein